MSDLKTYTVLYHCESVREFHPLVAPFGFICQAEDADHAEEQCINAYPDCDVVWVADGDSYQEALNDYWIV